MFSFGREYPEEEYNDLYPSPRNHSEAVHGSCDPEHLENGRPGRVENSEDVEAVAAVAASAALAAAVVGAPPHKAALAVESALEQAFNCLPRFGTYVLVACTAARISLSLGGTPEDASSAVRRAVKQAGVDRRQVTPVYDISAGDDASGNHDSDSEYCPEVTGSATSTCDSNTCQASGSKASAARLRSDSIIDSPAADTCSQATTDDASNDRYSQVELNDLTQALWNDTEGQTHISSIHEDRREQIDSEEHLLRYLVPSTEVSESYVMRQLDLWPNDRSIFMPIADLKHLDLPATNGQVVVDATSTSTQYGLHSGAYALPEGNDGRPLMSDPFIQTPPVSPRSQQQNTCSHFEAPLKNFADIQLMATDTRVRADLPTTPDSSASDGRSFRSAGRPAMIQTLAPKSPSCDKATIAYVSGDGDSAGWAEFLDDLVFQEALDAVVDYADSRRDLKDVRTTCTQDIAGMAEVQSGHAVQITSEFNLAMLLAALPHIAGNEVDMDPVPLDLMHEFGSCITQRSCGRSVETLCTQLRHAFAREGCNITCEVAEHLIRGKCDLFDAYVAMRQYIRRWNHPWSAKQPQTPEELYHL